MSIMQANLKHLYQRKALLLLFLCTALMSLIIITATINKAVWAIFGVLLLMFYIGASIGGLQIELLVKPFSYCLPGHRDVPVKLLFGGCIIVSSIFSFPFLFRSGSDLILAILQVLAVFSLSTVFYWFGVWAVSTIRKGGGLVGLLGLLPWIMTRTGTSSAVENFIFDNWISVLLLGFGVNCLAYRLLSDNGLARRYCGKKLLAGLDAWSSEKVAKFNQARLGEKDKKGPGYLFLQVETFFLNIISSPATGIINRHIFSAIYRTIAFARYLHPLRLANIVLYLLWLCLVGYLSPLAFFMGFIISLSFANMDLGIYSAMLVSGGRRERFYSALGLTIIVTVLVSTIFVIFSIISRFLVPIMPVIRSSTFTTIRIETAAIPLLMVPLIFAFKCYLENNITFVSCLIASVVLLPCFYIIITSGFGEELAVDITPMVAAVATLCSWILFVSILRYVCMRRCLTQ